MARQCFYIPVAQDADRTGGFVPSLVTEDEPGHSPMIGKDKYSAPWVWGKTLAEAEKTCASYNLTKLGISEKDASDIVLSSMRR